MIITPSPIPNQLVTTDGTIVRIKKIPIGTWNMTASVYLDISTGVSHSNWLMMQVALIADDGVLYMFHTGDQSPAGSIAGRQLMVAQLIAPMADDAVRLLRQTGDTFATTAIWNDTVTNRGYIILMYTD